MLKTKSVYEDKEPEDGIRILIMRKWPRGVSKTTTEDQVTANLNSVGSAPMRAGMPYFISPDASGVVTWVGSVPEKVTFHLKKLPVCIPGRICQENYIVLPLDTEIKTAKDLCEAKADDNGDLMGDYDTVAGWNVETQKQSPEGVFCSDIKDGYDFNVSPGEVLMLTVPRDENWTQK